MNKNSFTYEGTLLRSVGKEIEGASKKLRREASSLVYKRMKIKASDVWEKGKHSAPGEPPGKITGNLVKGIYKMDGKTSSFVGTHAPAFHAYLLEFGHWARMPKGSRPKSKKGTKRVDGKVWVAPRPFVYPTFDECESEVKAILAKQWLK